MWLTTIVRVLDAAKRSVTDLRNPVWDWEWSITAFLSHFALGFLLGLLATLLIVAISRLRGVSRVSKWDLRRMRRAGKNPSVFTRVRGWIERFCFGRRHEALFLDLFSFALRVAFFSGLIANLIDVDHAPMFYGGPDRILHWPVFALAIPTVLYCGARILRSRDEYLVRLYALWFCLAFSDIAHVLEDYLLGWF